MVKAQKAQQADDCGNTSNRQRTYAFTYNNGNSDIAQLIQYFHDAQYVFQEEKGEEGTPHLQGVVRWANKKTFEVLKKDWPKIHWEVCKTWKAWKKSISYCTKTETRVGGVFTNIKGLEWRSTLKDPLENKELFNWQRNVLNLIKTEPDDRSINWYWDKDGGVGKSALSKHILMNYNATLVGGKANDAKYAIKGWMESNPQKDLDIIIFDIPRANAEFINYGVFEEIKNGAIFSGKYESGCIMFNPLHIIVFANEHPDTSKLSRNKWNITYATPTK